VLRKLCCANGPANESSTHAGSGEKEQGTTTELVDEEAHRYSDDEVNDT